jgi:chemotaxis methyl-accepting protein methylase
LHPVEGTPRARSTLLHDGGSLEALYSLIEWPAPRSPDSSADPVRIWVQGCSTGDDAYAIAMVALQKRDACAHHRRLRLYATDIDERALERARTRCFSADDLCGVGAQRTADFFVRDDRQSFRASDRVRDAVTFAKHDFLRDPPFAHLDLVYCRWLAGQFSAEVHARLLLMLHASLKPGGHLVLRSGEIPAHLASLFEQVSPQWRIYRRCEFAYPIWRRFPILGDTDEQGRVAKSFAKTSLRRIEHEPVEALGQANEQLLVLHEELQTAQEEIEQVNDNLSARNLELYAKLNELRRAKEDVANFVGCAELAMVFLEPDYVIRTVTSGATRLLSFTASDVGRSLWDVTSAALAGELRCQLEEVLRLGVVRQAEIVNENGRTLLRRAHPYRALDDRIEGVVLVFIDWGFQKVAASA